MHVLLFKIIAFVESFLHFEPSEPTGTEVEIIGKFYALLSLVNACFAFLNDCFRVVVSSFRPIRADG